MWYRAHNGSNQQIGFAYSTDGYNWVKSRGNPVISRIQYDAKGEPSIIKDGDTWRMWYLAYENDTIKYLTATRPFEFSSIQSAIDAASPGDTVNVAAGTYTNAPWVSDIPVKGGTIKILEADGGSIPDSPTGGDITVTGGTAGATLVAAQYTSNPGGPHGLQAQGYYDVHLSDINGVTQVTIKFAPSLPNTVIYYWDEDGAAWTRCSDQTYINGVVTVTISMTGTMPGLSDLVGSTTAPALPFMPVTSPPTPPSPPIGGEAFPVSPWAANAPLIALCVVLAASAGVFVWRRTRA